MTRLFPAMALLALVLAGCVSAISLTDNVEVGSGTLGPVPADQMFLVRATSAEAADVVLAHERETGWPDPDIAWQDGRCVRLAWYEPRPRSFSPDPGPSFPVYLVRLVDQTGTAGVMWVMVDARTGELGTAIGDPLKSGCADEARPRVTFPDAE